MLLSFLSSTEHWVLAGVLFFFFAFFAGANLQMLLSITPDEAETFHAGLLETHRTMRTLETLGVPVVACINGAALGGGLEIALACHHRIATANPKTKIGQPEVKLGLLPGGGGTVRVTRMLGYINALMSVLVQGQEYRVDKAKELGLIDEVVADDETMLATARQWIKDNPDAASPGNLQTMS